MSGLEPIDPAGLGPEQGIVPISAPVMWVYFTKWQKLETCEVVIMVEGNMSADDHFEKARRGGLNVLGNSDVKRTPCFTYIKDSTGALQKVY